MEAGEAELSTWTTKHGVNGSSIHIDTCLFTHMHACTQQARPSSAPGRRSGQCKWIVYTCIYLLTYTRTYSRPFSCGVAEVEAGEAELSTWKTKRAV